MHLTKVRVRVEFVPEIIPDVDEETVILVRCEPVDQTGSLFA